MEIIEYSLQFRTLLYWCSSGNVPESPVVVDRLMEHLETFVAVKDDATWSGQDLQLVGRSAGALALLHMIIGRWLPVIE